jgi:predicted RNA-binding Zn-ribbon protein involved in translation (DUF1610 family)
MGYKGKINIYKCNKCGKKHITKDLEEGVTPFMIGCRNPGCNGDAQSSFYRADQSLDPEWEWYRPDEKEAKEISMSTFEHVKNGGLVLRRVDGEEDFKEEKEKEGYDGFCTLCNQQIKSFKGLNKCPNCGSEGIPCNYGNQVDVSINIHELRILCIWAENWANERLKDEPFSNVNTVYAIARRLLLQIKEDKKFEKVTLTMADEFRALKDAGFTLETDHPSDIP